MKHILFVFIVFVNFIIFAAYPFSNIKEKSEVLKLAKEADLVIEGQVVEIESVMLHRKERKIISASELTDTDLGKVWVYTKLKVEVLEEYQNKNSVSPENVDIWISGGLVSYGADEKVFKVSNTAYPFLEIGDIMIMGLSKNKEKTASKIFKEYKHGFHFHKMTDLQIPSSDKMIEEVEDGEVEKAKIYVKMMKEKKEVKPDVEFPDNEVLEKRLKEVMEKKNQIIVERKNFVKELKKSLGDEL